MAGNNIRSQTDRVLQNLYAILEQEKLNYDHVVKTTVYLANRDDFPAMNEAYAKYFTRNYPSRSTVQVASRPSGAKVHIAAVAGYG